MKAEPHSSTPVDADTGGAAETLFSEFRRLAASFHVWSHASFSLFGRRYDAPSSGRRERAGRLTSTACNLLADVLYMTMHCRQGSSVSSGIIVPRTGGSDDARFVSRLSNANSGTGSWHDGWTVRARNGQEPLGLERGGLRLWAREQDFVPDGGRIGVGVTGRVRFPKEYLNLYPGYYVALGNAHAGQRDNAVRLYWNVTADGAERLVARLSQRLNAALIDFQLKILNSGQRYDRTDAAILYVPKTHWAVTREIVGETHEDLRNWLKPALSAYVLALAPGVGLAEDPVEHVSFGQHRSRLLAASLSTASEHEDVLDALVRGVQTAGLDLVRFYANAGSRDEYSL